MGSVEALNKGAVIMSGFGGKSTAAWNAIYEKHRDFIAEFPLEFPNAMDESKRVSVSYTHLTLPTKRIV